MILLYLLAIYFKIEIFKKTNQPSLIIYPPFRTFNFLKKPSACSLTPTLMYFSNIRSDLCQVNQKIMEFSKLMCFPIVFPKKKSATLENVELLIIRVARKGLEPLTFGL